MVLSEHVASSTSPGREPFSRQVLALPDPHGRHGHEQMRAMVSFLLATLVMWLTASLTLH